MDLLVILLIALPAGAAIVAAALGAGRAALIRRICLAVTIADALIAIALAVAFVANNTKALWPGERGQDNPIPENSPQRSSNVPTNGAVDTPDALCASRSQLSASCSELTSLHHDVDL